MEPKRVLTVLVALIAVASGFLALAAYPPPEGLITKDTAIMIIEASAKADPTHQIVREDNLVGAELEYMAIHWENYLRTAGYHRRIYVSTTPVGDVSPYWVISYGKPVWHYFSLGLYVVDAVTGELMLAYEDTGGPPQESDYMISITPAVHPGTPITLRAGETKTLTITLTAQPSYDASLPIHITATGAPDYLTVRQNATTGVLTTNGRVSVEVRVSAGTDAFDATVDNPRIFIEITLLGTISGIPLDIAIQR